MTPGRKDYAKNGEDSSLADFVPVPYLGEVGGNTKIKNCRQHWVYNKYSHICLDKSRHMYKYLLLDMLPVRGE